MTEQHFDPPRFALRLISWICPPPLAEGIVGDLIEAFEHDVSRIGIKRARFRFWSNTLRFARPGILLRHRLSINIIHWSMLKNYFTVAWRTLLRNKGYSSINIIGLTLGISVALLLMLIIRYEYSFDQYHTKANRIYQIQPLDKFNEYGSHVPQGLIRAINEKVPSVEKAANVFGLQWVLIKVNGKNMKQSNAFFVDPGFFDMFDVTWIEGSPAESLSRPYQIVLNQSTARKLFGGDNPMGQLIKFENSFEATVSGVIKDVPGRSDFQLEMVLSNETLKKFWTAYAREDYWDGGDSSYHGYVLINDDADVASIERIATSFIAERNKNEIYTSCRLVPLADVHFDSNTDPFNYTTPRWTLNVLTAIAAFIILIASINFINLATAQATTRAREIAVRKVLGSRRRAIIVQFLSETLVMVFIAVALSIGVVSIMLPYTPTFFLTTLSLHDAWDVTVLEGLVLLIAVVTFLAGIYPAFILSGFKTVSILRGFRLLNSGSVDLRKVLVVFQFAIAQLMIIGMITGTRQMKYIREADLGFESKDVINVELPYPDSTLLQDRIRTQLLANSAIKDVAFGLASPASVGNWWGNTSNPRFLNGEEQFRLQWIDPNYVELFDIPLLAGRNFVDADSSGYALINMKAVRALGLKDASQAIGERLTYWGTNTVKVIGVIGDYQSQTLKEEIPAHIFMSGRNFQQLQIRIDATKKSEAIAHIQSVWTSHHPDYFFEYAILKDTLNNFYRDETKLSNLVSLFGSIGIVIGCMGLFALISFVAAKRSKEMSIRKVLGASIGNITMLLTKDFVAMVMIAMLIAAPFGWYAMSTYLAEYKEHISIDWSIFAVAGIVTLGLALVTVSSRSISAAMANPVDHLKQE